MFVLGVLLDETEEVLSLNCFEMESPRKSEYCWGGLYALLTLDSAATGGFANFV